MAITLKKKFAAKTVAARVKSAPDEMLVVPNAPEVMQELMKDAEIELQAGKEAFAAPAAEIQQRLRTALEKGIAESRAAFTKAKVAADEAASAFEVSFVAAKDGALAINAKALDAWRVNADANFDFLKAAFAVKSLPDFVTLQTEFTRKQVETMTGQTRDFGALAQKAMADAVAPIKQMTKSFKFAA